jgi:hypothetical protein
MAGLVLHPDDLKLAVQHASVAVRPLLPSFLRLLLTASSSQASFIIEQFGLPKVKTGEDGAERWNDVSPVDRLRELQAREV